MVISDKMVVLLVMCARDYYYVEIFRKIVIAYYTYY